MSDNKDTDKVSINMDEIDQMINDTMKEAQMDETVKEIQGHHEENGKRQGEFHEESDVMKKIKTDLDLGLEMQQSEGSVNSQFEDINASSQSFVGDHLAQSLESSNKSQTTHENDNTNGDSNNNEHGHHDTLHNSTEDSNNLFSSSNINESNKESVGTVIHQGVAIPADSELLKKSSAFTAYNELSSQLPTLPVAPNSHLTALPMALIAADYLPPRIQLLVNTLPTLDNLATQVLRVFTVGPYQKIIDLVSNADTIQGASFRDLTSLFEITKKLYSDDEPFLSVTHIAPEIWKENEKTPIFFKSREQSIESTLRKTNLATFLLATLGVIEVGFFYLNESFLNIFCPMNNLDPENSLSNSNEKGLSLQGGGNNVIGDKIGKLLKPQAVLYLDLKTQAYISAIEAGERSRKEILDDILPENLEEILLYKRDTKTLSATELDFIERCKGRRSVLLNHPDNTMLSEEYEWFQFLKNLFEFVSKNMLFLIWGNKKITKPVSRTEINQDVNSTSQTENPPTITKPSDLTDSFLPSEILEQQLHMNLPTKPSNRISNRRPWTREEEKALRHALELKGPHWSSILELFGAGGKMSEALKNRTQVQLKDKARNWKMFFLKSGLPVPQYLQKVTGDLERDERTRKKTAAAPVPNLPTK